MATIEKKMENINIEIISKEMIKPSSPTPNHLQNYKLSFIDQMAPSHYIPLIFFYQIHDKNEPTLNTVKLHISRRLKHSLSQVLTIFYPLAGTIQENSSVHCNDAGVEFIEARVHACLSEVIKDPKLEVLEQFLPVKPLGKIGSVVLSVKISFFDCGGLAISVCLSHKVADGTSLVAFMNAWAEANVRDGVVAEVTNKPNFDLAVHFPAQDFSKHCVRPIQPIENQKITTKRFVFDSEKMKKLKLFAANGDHHTTRVEAVSAFLLQRFIEVTKVKRGIEQTLFAAVHVVNMRPRMNPPLSDLAFGNCWRPTMAEISSQNDGYDCSILLHRLRDSIKRIDDRYIKKLQKGENLDDHSSKRSALFRRNVQALGFTSWCRFPLYEVDFEWGKPVWVCTTTLPFKNLVILMSTTCGYGVEAWVNLAEDELEMLETHYKLLN